MKRFSSILPDTASSRELAEWCDAEVAAARDTIASVGCDERTADRYRGEIAALTRLKERLAPPKEAPQEPRRGSLY